jgi:hypothetical protein
VIFVITEIDWGQYQEIKRSYTLGIVEPISYLALSLFVTSLVLLRVGASTYRRWLRGIFVWYVPVSVLIIAGGSTSTNPSSIARGDLAALLGTGLVIVTIGFIFIQRFVYKHS